MKRPVGLLALILFFASWCSAEDQSKPSIKTGLAASALSSSTTLKQTVVSSIQTSTPQASSASYSAASQVYSPGVVSTARTAVPVGPQVQQAIRNVFDKAGAVGPESPIEDFAGTPDVKAKQIGFLHSVDNTRKVATETASIDTSDGTEEMDPSMRRAAHLEVGDGVWVTRTPPATIPGSDSTLPGLGGGSIDQSEIVSRSKAPKIPSGQTVLVDNELVMLPAPVVSSTTPFDIPSSPIAKMLADGKTTPSVVDAFQVPIGPTDTAGASVVPGDSYMDPSMRRAAAPLIVDAVWVTKTAPATVSGSDSTLPGLGGGSIDQSEVEIKSEFPVIPDEDTILPGGPSIAASAPVDTTEETITPASGIIAKMPATESGKKDGDTKKASQIQVYTDAKVTTEESSSDNDQENE